ncbi:MAG: hypothetical protein A3I04_01270 [Nitrospinae bacterium RIFCSPLOWO2_02_FULL_39_110]|nr:MAG: hypothetical protein A3D20_03580 [Nitrospinae bacterium RIFCSPHIGHO2_02_FULL_39_82]OGW03995.1 MAG: hypothetical protein A3I04_01270 [Nitrospinae bacterium RIFCSPLOWO2_02_FULL_39_110]
MLSLKGQIVSVPGISPKGVGFKVMIPDLGDSFRVFIPVEKVNGHDKLKMGEAVTVTINRFFPRKNEVGLELISLEKVK